MGEIAYFPKVHNYCVCCECDGYFWQILWPQDETEAWYIECSDCGQQYKKELITGYPFDDEGYSLNDKTSP